MMRPGKILLTLACAACLSAGASAQSALSLDECFRLADARFPGSAIVVLQGELGQARREQLNRNYWPKLEINGQASWQNEVTRVDIPLQVPGFEVPSQPKDQYRVMAEWNQLLFDAGSTRHLKAATLADTRAESNQAEAERYRLRFQVSQLYFGILLQAQQIRALELVREELARRQRQLRELYDGGVVQRKDLELLEVDVLRNAQLILQARSQSAVLRDNLGILLGRDVPEDLTLELPDEAPAPPMARPEWQVFQAREEALRARKRALTTGRLPRLYAFAQGGIGRPGFNLFDPDPQPMFLAGARLRWNLGALYTDGPERRALDLGREIVRKQEESFRQGLDIQIRQAKGNAAMYRDFLQADRDMLERRIRIRDIAAVQLEEGILPAPDYLREVDAWYQADLLLATHRIKALQAATEARLLAGKAQ